MNSTNENQSDAHEGEPQKTPLSPTRKLVFATSIIVVLLVGATIGLIVWRNGQKLHTPTTKQEAQQLAGKSASPTTTQGATAQPLTTTSDKNAYQVKSLTETYVENNLAITTKSETTSIKINNLDLKITVDYDQISGLRNKAVENKVNRAIQDTAMYCGKLAGRADSSYTSYPFNFSIMANYGDVISCGSTLYDENGNAILTKDCVLNLRLDTGEPIKFGDLFTAGANLNQIIADGYINSNIRGGENDGSIKLPFDAQGNQQTNREEQQPATTDSSSEGTEDFYDDTSDYSRIEATLPDEDNGLFSFVQDFNANPDIPFYFDQNYIRASVDGHEIEIEMATRPQSIAIYKRFLSRSSLYTSTQKLVSTFVFCAADNYEFGKLTGNLFVIALVDDESGSDIIDQNTRKIADARIVDAKTWAAQHPNQAFIVGIECSGATDYVDQQNNDAICCCVTVNEYRNTVDKAHFEEALAACAQDGWVPRSPADGGGWIAMDLTGVNIPSLITLSKPQQSYIYTPQGVLERVETE
ncbi:MAG: hypothetical protein FWD65_03725 [Coriobacteriia bacterium]|nr:hypothetical protein [Coriobacteriia bacterium]